MSAVFEPIRVYAGDDIQKKQEAITAFKNNYALNGIENDQGEIDWLLWLANVEKSNNAELKKLRETLKSFKTSAEEIRTEYNKMKNDSRIKDALNKFKDNAASYVSFDAAISGAETQMASGIAPTKGGELALLTLITIIVIVAVALGWLVAKLFELIGCDANSGCLWNPKTMTLKKY